MFSFGAGAILTQTSLEDLSFCADPNMGKTGSTITVGNCIIIHWQIKMVNHKTWANLYVKKISIFEKFHS